jgi:hypothetical protein
MANKNVEAKSDEPQESYFIVSYRTSAIPQQYVNLILSPFLTTLKSGNDEFKMIDRDSYFKNYKAYIYSLFDRPESKVNLALLTDPNLDVALGWCLFEKNIVHYVWVKEEVRRTGICKALLPKHFDIITHRTNVGKNIWLKNYPDVIYDPWARA